MPSPPPRPTLRALPACLLFGLVAAALGTEAASSRPQPPEWTEPIPPFRIAGNLYYVGTAELTSFLFATPAGHVLLDVPLDENVDLVFGNVEALGFAVTDVKVLLNSHAHYDHVGGLARAKAKTGAKVYLARGDADLAARGGRGDFGLGDVGPYPPVVADVVFDDGEVVALGDTRLVAHATPGHTRGCTTWSAKLTEAGQPLDAVFVCSLSLLDYRLTGAKESYPGIGHDFCASVATLRGLPVDLFFAAHGSFFDLREKAERQAARKDGDGNHPFADAAGYAAYVDEAARKIDVRLAEGGLAGGCAALSAGATTSP